MNSVRLVVRLILGRLGAKHIAQISDEKLDALAGMHDPLRVRRILVDTLAAEHLTQFNPEQLDVLADFYFHVYACAHALR